MRQAEHFHLHEGQFFCRVGMAAQAKRWRRRTLCERLELSSKTRALRADSRVTCPECQVLQDAWLQLAKRRRLTVRRLRALKRAIAAGEAVRHG